MAAVLALTTVLLTSVDLNIGQLPHNAGPPLCFLPAMIGPFLLSPLEELGVCLVFFASWIITRIGSDAWTPRFILSLLGPLPLMLALVWLAQLRLHSKTQQLQLLRQQGDLEQKLHSSLQASALAHELGQPLSQLLLQTRLVHYRLEQVDQIPAEALKPLEQLKQSGEHIQELTAAIRRLLRNDAAVQRLDLSDLLRRCLLPLQRTALDAGIQLQLDGLHQSAFVMGDSQQLAIAINNLLRNAEHSLLEVAPAQRLLRVALSQAHGRIVLHIADRGAGLPSNDPEALTLNSHKSGGMGLGVLMVRSIARGHGGELQLGRSTDLGGAEVSLSFPTAP